MKFQATVTLMAILTLFPLAASAQGFGNLNINLNDVMVEQRMQDMTGALDAENAAQTPKVKHHHFHLKHHKKNANQDVILLQDEQQNPSPDQKAMSKESVANN